MIGVAEEIKYLMFNGMPLEGSSLDATFDLVYNPVNISDNNFDEKWSIKPWQYNDILVLLRGTGKVNVLNFTFNDTTSALPEIISYGYLQGYDNLSAIIQPHYLRVLANGSSVAAMDGAERGGFGITSYVNLFNTRLHLIDPVWGINVEGPIPIKADVLIEATNPADTRLENISVCINVSCSEGYRIDERRYLNLSGTLSAPVEFTIMPQGGQCEVITCVDCDNAIPEYNESDNCGIISLPNIAPVPISRTAALILLVLLLTIGIFRIKKKLT